MNMIQLQYTAERDTLLILVGWMQDLFSYGGKTLNETQFLV
jgi:hypothetical protein